MHLRSNASSVQPCRATCHSEVRQRPMTRVLVIDGNEATTRAKHVSAGGMDSGDGYVITLKQIHADIQCDIVRPADEEPRLPVGVTLGDYDGAVITGSALNVYERAPAVQRQVELARAVFAAGVPCFGSCWGLQVGVTAAGGTVIRNPRGPGCMCRSKVPPPYFAMCRHRPLPSCRSWCSSSRSASVRCWN
ncbi:MAG: hypothetical protein AB7P78_19535, partial [Candidatus Binatia bacterium]